MTFPTLSEFFEQTFLTIWIRPRNLDPKTERSYRESLKLWRLHTGDPSVNEITRRRVAEFCAALVSHPGKKQGTTMTAASRSKHCRQLDLLLKSCGPPTRTNRDGQSVLDYEPPFFDRVRVLKSRTQKLWTIEELYSLYRSADLVKKPVCEGFSTANFWRSLLVLGYYSGIRITELLSCKYSQIHNHVLQADQHDGKNKKTDPHWLPLEAIEHIERIRTSDRDVILYVKKYERQKRLLYDDLHSLQDAAGFPLSRQWGFHTIRRAHANALKHFRDPNQGNLKVAQRSLGHSNSSITLGHYISETLEDQETIRAIGEIPSPVPPEFRKVIELVTLTDPPKPTRELREHYQRQEEFID